MCLYRALHCGFTQFEITLRMLETETNESETVFVVYVKRVLFSKGQSNNLNQLDRAWGFSH